MRTYIAIFMIATFSSLVLTPLLRRACQRFGWLDEPRGDRTLHIRPMPRLGGIAIFISLGIGLVGLLFLDNQLTQAIRPISNRILVTFVPATLVLLLGIYDDLRGVNAIVKLIGIAAAGALLYAMGGRIELVSIPLVGAVTLPPMLAFAVTIFWTVAISNAFNLIDGVDGLATGAALFASLVIFIVSLVFGNPVVTVVALALTGSLLGFLRYNFNPASIFLGDSGALFVGFTLAALSVTGSEKASTAIAVAIPVMAFGLPVVDASITLTRRFLSGKPIFQADREHIHHMLLARGWSQRQVALVLYGVCALFGTFALLFVTAVQHTAGLILFVVSAAFIMAVERLRYHEVDELKASVKRNFGDRRVRAANNIRVRRACRTLANAATLAQLFDGVLELLKLEEFVCAAVQLSYDGRPEINAAALESSNGSASVQRATLRDGRIHWTWQREGCDANELVDGVSHWTLRLPLATERMKLGYLNLYRPLDGEPMQVDVNYLCSMFRTHLSEAAERILVECESNSEKQMRFAAASSH
jgi:UDP-GlcNAc:undecaprenyl-phosphate/decaprenyl-phosphate GlcNAc-1-phosphate transferase